MNWLFELHTTQPVAHAVGVLALVCVVGMALGSVKVIDETIAVRAQVHTLGGFSAHAGQTDLLNWFGAIAPSRPQVVLIHGEDGPRLALTKLIQQRHGLTPVLPKQGDVIEV